MQGWEAALAAAGAGALGGLANALMSDNGFVLPKNEATPDGSSVWRPGVTGTVIVGAIAAVVSWALYGAGAGQSILSTTALELTWAGAAAAVLVGVGGSRWLTSEVDKTLLKKTASAAASKDANPSLANVIATSSPAAGLRAVRNAP
jgi:hypothetical protein